MGGCDSVKNVIVFKRTGGDVAMVAGRDIWCTTVANQPETCEPEWVEAEHPLFLLYTSVPPASRRASSTPPAATCCTPS